MRALVLLLALVAVGCGPKTVRLTKPQLDDLFTCVTERAADGDQVEAGNCIERLGEPR